MSRTLDWDDESAWWESKISQEWEWQFAWLNSFILIYVHVSIDFFNSRVWSHPINVSLRFPNCNLFIFYWLRHKTFCRATMMQGIIFVWSIHEQYCLLKKKKYFLMNIRRKSLADWCHKICPSFNLLSHFWMCSLNIYFDFFSFFSLFSIEISISNWVFWKKLVKRLSVLKI